MNVAGPSRRGRVESTYEEDLLGLLNQLSLDEMDEIQTFFTHRTRTGDPLSDHDVAMNDVLQQARALAVLNEDRVLAQRIAAGDAGVTIEQRPVQRPGAVPPPIGNGTAVQRNVNQQHAGQPAARNDAVQSQTWGGWLSSMVGWVFGADPAVPGQTNAAAAAPKTSVANRPTGHNCVICQDPIYGAEIRAPCGHYYGIDCVTDLFQSAIRDESLFPPRCCRQNIPLGQVQPHLPQALITTFQQKQVEFGTLKRVYCSSPTCSRFLGPLFEGMFSSKIYTCPAPGCGRRTCGKCREQHSGDWTHTCRPDADAAQVLELSRAAGWARCPGCSQMIELHIGCFHMTCRCRTEFCYLCRARWKTCRCPQWDERRLLAAAEERVDAQLGVGRERGAQRDVPAQRAGPVPVPVLANRAQAGVVGARPAVPAPAPVPAQRPALVPTPAHPLAPARPAAPARPPTVDTLYPLRPTPARAPTASSSTARPTSTISTNAREGTNYRAEGWRNSVASTSTSTGSSASARTWADLASGSGSGWRSRIASASASASTSASRPASTSQTNARGGTNGRIEGCVASSSTYRGSSISVLASASVSASVSASKLASSARRSTSTSTSAPTFTRPKSLHNADPTRQRLVREMMDRLREDHECNHAQWRYRRGGGICQSCGHHLPLYLFRCLGCEMLACNRCRRNRL